MQLETLVKSSTCVMKNWFCTHTNSSHNAGNINWHSSHNASCNNKWHSSYNAGNNINWHSAHNESNDLLGHSMNVYLWPSWTQHERIWPFWTQHECVCLKNYSHTFLFLWHPFHTSPDLHNVPTSERQVFHHNFPKRFRDLIFVKLTSHWNATR